MRRVLLDDEARMSSSDVPLAYSFVGRSAPQYETALSHLKTSHSTSVACQRRHEPVTIAPVMRVIQ